MTVFCLYVLDKGQCGSCDGRYCCGLPDGHDGGHKTHDGYTSSRYGGWYLDEERANERALEKLEADAAVMRAALITVQAEHAHTILLGHKSLQAVPLALATGAGAELLAEMESLRDGNRTYQVRDKAFEADAALMREALNNCLLEIKAWLDHVGLRTQVERALEVGAGKGLTAEVNELRHIVATLRGEADSLVVSGAEKFIPLSILALRAFDKRRPT